MTVAILVIIDIAIASLIATIESGVLVLVYADMRMRKEGMDLVLLQAAADRRLTGDEFASSGPTSAYTGGADPRMGIGRHYGGGYQARAAIRRARRLPGRRLPGAAAAGIRPARGELTGLMIVSSAAAAGSAATRLAGGPLIGRRAAQRLARHELAETSIWQRIWHWLARLPGTAGQRRPRRLVRPDRPGDPRGTDDHDHHLLGPARQDRASGGRVRAGRRADDGTGLPAGGRTPGGGR